MKSRNLWTGLIAAAGMLVLILDSRTAVAGIREGIELCLRTLIPSLFPFFVFSILMTGSILGENRRFLRPLGRICGIPEGSEPLFLTGILGGYPVGAQNIALACARGNLSRKDAQRMLGFCSNAGPSFLFGIVGQAFDSLWVCWVLWGIHIASAVFVGRITRGRSHSRAVLPRTNPITLTQALSKALNVMAQVSGWVILFRMLLNYLDRWFLWLLPTEIQVLVSGILELSNGCVQLRSLPSEGMRLVAASVMLALGGLCVMLQTFSVANGLSLKYYFPGKMMQTAISVILAMLVQPLLPGFDRWIIPWYIPFLTGIIFVISALFLQKNQKSSSIPPPIGV